MVLLTTIMMTSEDDEYDDHDDNDGEVKMVMIIMRWR